MKIIRGFINPLLKTARARPYWLLLALALFFAGQIAVTAHWHNDSSVNDSSSLNGDSSPDIDCALCLLSSAAGAALIADTLIIAGVALCQFIFIIDAPVFISRHVVFYHSRAPPVYS